MSVLKLFSKVVLEFDLEPETELDTKAIDPGVEMTLSIISSSVWND